MTNEAIRYHLLETVHQIGYPIKGLSCYFEAGVLELKLAVLWIVSILWL